MDDTLQNPSLHEYPAANAPRPQWGQSQHSWGKDMISSTQGHAVTASGDGGTVLERAPGTQEQQGCLCSSLLLCCTQLCIVLLTQLQHRAQASTVCSEQAEPPQIWWVWTPGNMLYDILCHRMPKLWPLLHCYTLVLTNTCSQVTAPGVL